MHPSTPLTPLLHFHLCGEFQSFNSSPSITSIYLHVPLYLHIYTDIYISTKISTYLHGYLCAAADKCGFGGWAEWSECENNKKQRKREVGWDTRGVAYFSYINKSFQHISFFFSLVTCFPCRMALSRYFSSQLQIASCWYFCKSIDRCLNLREYQTKNLCLS